MKEPDWSRGWELLEKYKASLDNTRLGWYKPTLDAIADLLNKQDVSGYTLIMQFFMQESVIRFNNRYVSKVYDYREWFEDRVELADQHFPDIDEAYREAFKIASKLEE